MIFFHFPIKIPNKTETSEGGGGISDELEQKQKLFWASLDQWNGIR